MEKRIKVVFKRNRETPACVVEIENTLEAFQELVEGRIEVGSRFAGFLIICNEEGRLRKMPENVFGFVGPIVLCGVDGSDCCGILHDDAEWLAWLLDGAPMS